MLSPDNPVHYRAHSELLRALGREVRARFTASSQDWHTGSNPQDTFSMGLLTPRYRNQKDRQDETERLERRSPSRMGYDFYIPMADLDKATLSISVSGLLFAGIIPTWEQAKDRIQPPGQEDKNPRWRLDRWWKPHKLRSKALEIRIADLYRTPIVGLELARKELELLRNQMRSDPQAMRVPSHPRATDIKLRTMPRDEQEYIAALDEVLKPDLADLDYRLELEAMALRHPSQPDTLLVRLWLSNASPSPPEQTENLQSPYIFDVNMRTELAGSSWAKVSNSAVLDDDYRYDPNQASHGHNTNTLLEASAISFDHFPEYAQPTYGPSLLGPEAEPQFELLASDPIPRLKAMASAMDAYAAKRWTSAFFDQCVASGLLPEDAERQPYEEARQDFLDETRRFKHGIAVLERHADVLQAFKLMNRTLMESVRTPNGQLRFRTWRTFQIVFIVSVIPDVARREYEDAAFQVRTESGRNEEGKDIVDVLWFPTGGGKTETYLGIIAWNFWWDRIRGKNNGVTAWAKFPLRFLSLQQQNRFLRVIICANGILGELKAAGSFGKAQIFTLGYFVGGRNTPNSWQLDDPTSTEPKSIFRILEDDTEKTREWNVVPNCPMCGSRTALRPDEENLRLQVQCPNPQHGILPVLLIDEEIYRYAPTVLVGTLDKMAVMAFNPRFKRLFLGDSYYCPDHGYAAHDPKKGKAKCGDGKGTKSMEKCDRVVRTPALHDAAPTLLLQDELHLVEATLGAFESHYESFMDFYQANLLPALADSYAAGSRTRGSWKILGASATITGFDQQVKNLYLKGSVRFPHPGPTRFENFYAGTQFERTRRLFMGFRPNNMPTPTALRETLLVIHKFIARRIANPDLLRNDAPSAQAFETSDLKQLLDHVCMSMSYHLNKNEAVNIEDWWENEIPNKLEGILPADVNPSLEKLTGDTPFYDVVDIDSRMKQPANTAGDYLGHIAATKMVSHGVDVDRLNVMVFDGMPRNHSEYIQSGSRAGRTWPGLVIAIINTKRPRETSHYEFHRSYHDRLDLHVDNVAVTRWGTHTHEKTAPGLVAAYVLLVVTPRRNRAGLPLTQPKHFQEAIALGTATKLEFKDNITKAYGAFRDPNGSAYRQQLPALIGRILESVLSNSTAPTFVDAFRDYAPMRSMRDIEGTMTIGVDEATIRFLEGRQGGKIFRPAPKDADSEDESEDAESDEPENPEREATP